MKYSFFDYSISVFLTRNGDEVGRDQPAVYFAVNMSESLTNTRFCVLLYDKGEKTQPK
jgi:hypothetical protein